MKIRFTLVFNTVEAEIYCRTRYIVGPVALAKYISGFNGAEECLHHQVKYYSQPQMEIIYFQGEQ